MAHSNGGRLCARGEGFWREAALRGPVGGEAGPGGLLNPGHPSGEKMGVKVRELENRGIKLGNRE